MSRATLMWRRLWPGVTKPNVPPAPGPVKTLRPSRYTLQVSTNGRKWRTVATSTPLDTGTTDVLRFASVRARYARLRIVKGSQRPLPKTKTDPNPPPTTPMLMELTLSR